jgi:hypothetical protein
MLAHDMAEQLSPGSSIFRILGNDQQESFNLVVYHERDVDLGVTVPKE